jgi:hypothetical protein
MNYIEHNCTDIWCCIVFKGPQSKGMSEKEEKKELGKSQNIGKGGQDHPMKQKGMLDYHILLYKLDLFQCLSFIPGFHSYKSPNILPQ